MENINDIMGKMEERAMAFENTPIDTLLEEKTHENNLWQQWSVEEQCDLELAILTKVHTLRIEGSKALHQEQLKDYLLNMKWKHCQKLCFCEAIADIYETRESDLFEFLRYKGIVEAKNLALEDFEELIMK